MESFGCSPSKFRTPDRPNSSRINLRNRQKIETFFDIRHAHSPLKIANHFERTVFDALLRKVDESGSMPRRLALEKAEDPQCASSMPVLSLLVERLKPPLLSPGGTQRARVSLDRIHYKFIARIIKSSFFPNTFPSQLRASASLSEKRAERAERALPLSATRNIGKRLGVIETPFAVRHSPFAIRRSPLAVRHSPSFIRLLALPHQRCAQIHHPDSVSLSSPRCPYSGESVS